MSDWQNWDDEPRVGANTDPWAEYTARQAEAETALESGDWSAYTAAADRRDRAAAKVDEIAESKGRPNPPRTNELVEDPYTITNEKLNALSVKADEAFVAWEDLQTAYDQMGTQGQNTPRGRMLARDRDAAQVEAAQAKLTLDSTTERMRVAQANDANARMEIQRMRQELANAAKKELNAALAVLEKEMKEGGVDGILAQDERGIKQAKALQAKLAAAEDFVKAEPSRAELDAVVASTVANYIKRNSVRPASAETIDPGILAAHKQYTVGMDGELRAKFLSALTPTQRQMAEAQLAPLAS